MLHQHSKIKDAILSCKRSKDAYLDHKAITKHYKHAKFYEGRKHDAQGFLFYDKQRIYVTYRGTMDLMDTKDIIDIRHQSIFSHNIKVHKGFHSQFFAIEEDITSDIKDIIKSYPVKELVFAGHSMGGSCAVISSPYYATLLKNKYSIKTFTFGTVSIGNKDFVKWFTDNVNEHYRIENKNDLIPYIPVHQSFCHIPNGIIIDDNGNITQRSETLTLSYKDLLFTLINEKENITKFHIDHSCDKYQSNLMLSWKKNPSFWQ
jgi:hypothetical protein